MPTSLAIFYSYAAKDEPLLVELENHLAPLRQEGLIQAFHRGKIVAGAEQQQAIQAALNSASIVLLLVSSDFLASDPCNQEVIRALERRTAGDTEVVPVLVRMCAWQQAPFAGLQPVPANGTPVTSWANQDEAWSDVATRVRAAVERRRLAEAARSREDERLAKRLAQVIDSVATSLEKRPRVVGALASKLQVKASPGPLARAVASDLIRSRKAQEMALVLNHVDADLANAGADVEDRHVLHGVLCQVLPIAIDWRQLIGSARSTLEEGPNCIDLPLRTETLAEIILAGIDERLCRFAPVDTGMPIGAALVRRPAATWSAFFDVDGTRFAEAVVEQLAAELRINDSSYARRRDVIEAKLDYYAHEAPQGELLPYYLLFDEDDLGAAPPDGRPRERDVWALAREVLGRELPSLRLVRLGGGSRKDETKLAMHIREIFSRSIKDAARPVVPQARTAPSRPPVDARGAKPSATEARTIGPADVVDHMKVEDGLYVLGCFERRVTLLSQQVRALNLIYSLRAQGLLDEGASIAVIGGGIAGCMAAAGAARLGCDVTLLEQREELLHLFRGNHTRWLHPHLYDWPLDDATSHDAGLPLLDWHAGLADDVVRQIQAGWDGLPERGRIQVHTNVTITDLGSSSPRRLTWIAPGSKKGNFALAILAVGFGLERRFSGIPWRSYWDNDSLHQAARAGGARTLISGTGDGGLIDVLRARLRDFRHDEVLATFLANPALEPVKARLLAIEKEAVRLELRREGGSRDYLNDQYEALPVPAEVDKAIEARLRTDGTTVVLNGLDPLPLSLGASIVNRFLVSRLLNRFELAYRPGQIGKPKKKGNAFEVQFAMGPAVTFDVIIGRHGPESALQSGFSSIWTRCAATMGARSRLDQTRWPIYGDAFAAPSGGLPHGT